MTTNNVYLYLIAKQTSLISYQVKKHFKHVKFKMEMLWFHHNNCLKKRTSEQKRFAQQATNHNTIVIY